MGRLAVLGLLSVILVPLAAQADTFYACARPNGTLMPQITVNTVPTCQGSTTVVSWESGPAQPTPYVESSSATLEPTEERCVTAACAPGDRVQTGGWQVSGPGDFEGNNVLVSLDQACCGPPHAPTSWTACVQNISANPITLLVFANCLDQTP